MIRAAAATSGEQIVFSDRRPGRYVVAHELAHVLQYRQARGTIRAGMSQRNDAAEHDADEIAGGALRNDRVEVKPSAMASVMRQASPEQQSERVTFAELQRANPDIAHLFISLSEQYLAVEEEIYPLLIAAGIDWRASAASIHIGQAHQQIKSQARLMAEMNQYTARRLAYWVDALDTATGGWLLDGIELADLQLAKDPEAKTMLEAARHHRVAMRESITTLQSTEFIQRGYEDAKERVSASRDVPKPPAIPLWGSDHEKILSDLALLIDQHVHQLVVEKVRSIPPVLRRQLMTRFEDRYGGTLLLAVRDNSPAEVLKDVTLLLMAADPKPLELKEALEVHVYEGIFEHDFDNSANNEAIVDILRLYPHTATMDEAKRDEIIDLLSRSMSRAAFFEAHKLLRPDNPVTVVQRFSEAADGWVWDDRQGVYDAIIGLEPDQRSEFWRMQESREAIRRIDADNWSLVAEMCMATESRALEIRTILATQGLGTTESGLEAVAKRAKVAAERERKVAASREFLARAMAKGLLPSEDAAQLAELRRLDIQQSGFLDIHLDESGEIQADTALGMIRADVDRFEFQRIAAAMGVTEPQLAKQQIRDASGRIWDVEQEMFDAIQRLPKEQRARVSQILDEAGSEELAAADTFVARALAGLSKTEKEIARDYAGEDLFRIAMRRLQTSPPYMETLRVLADMSFEERNVRMLHDPEHQDVWYDLWKRSRYDPAIKALLEMKDRFPSDSILEHALGRPWDGTSESLAFFALERLPPDLRKTYRDGYWLFRTGKPTEDIPGGRQALEAFTTLNERLAGEMHGAELQTAYDRLLGPPPIAEIIATDEPDIADPETQRARRQAADIIFFRVSEKFGTRGGLADAFTGSDETLTQALILFESRYRSAIGDGVVTLHELEKLAALEQNFNQRYEGYLASTSTVAEYASMVTAFAAGIAVTAATGGLAAPAVGATWGTFGLAIAGGAAALAGTHLATKELFLADRFNITDEQGFNEAMAGAVDGALAVATAGLGGAIRKALFSGTKLGGVNIAKPLLTVGDEALEHAVYLSPAGKAAGRSALKQITTETIESAIEESIGSAFSELVLTALDENTYDKTMWDVLAAFGWASLSGAATGAVTGGAFGGAFAAGGIGLEKLGRKLGVTGAPEPEQVQEALHPVPAVEHVVVNVGGGQAVSRVTESKPLVEAFSTPDLDDSGVKSAPSERSAPTHNVGAHLEIGRGEAAVIVRRDEYGRPVGFEVRAGPDIHPDDLTVHIEIARDLERRYTGFIGTVRVVLETIQEGLTGRLAPYREGVLELRQEIYKLDRLMQLRLRRMDTEALNVGELQDIQAEMALLQHQANRAEDALREPERWLVDFPKDRFFQRDRPDGTFPETPTGHIYLQRPDATWDLRRKRGYSGPRFNIEYVEGKPHLSNRKQLDDSAILRNKHLADPEVKKTIEWLGYRVDSSVIHSPGGKDGYLALTTDDQGVIVLGETQPLGGRTRERADTEQPTDIQIASTREVQLSRSLESTTIEPIAQESAVAASTEPGATTAAVAQSDTGHAAPVIAPTTTADLQFPSYSRIFDVGHGAFNLSVDGGRVHVYDAGSFLEGQERATTLDEIVNVIPGGRIHALHISSWDADHQNLVSQLVSRVEIEQVFVHAHMLTGKKPVVGSQRTPKLNKETLPEALGVGEEKIFVHVDAESQSDKPDLSVGGSDQNKHIVPLTEFDKGKHIPSTKIRRPSETSHGSEGVVAYLLRDAAEAATLETRRKGVRTFVSPDATVDVLTPLFEDPKFLARLKKRNDDSEVIELYLYLISHHMGASFFSRPDEGMVERFLDALIEIQSQTGPSRHVVSTSFRKAISPESPYLLAAAGLEVRPAPLTIRGTEIQGGEPLSVGPEPALRGDRDEIPYRKAYMQAKHHLTTIQQELDLVGEPWVTKWKTVEFALGNHKNIAREVEDARGQMEAAKSEWLRHAGDRDKVANITEALTDPVLTGMLKQYVESYEKYKRTLTKIADLRKESPALPRLERERVRADSDVEMQKAKVVERLRDADKFDAALALHSYERGKESVTDLEAKQAAARSQIAAELGNNEAMVAAAFRWQELKTAKRAYITAVRDALRGNVGILRVIVERQTIDRAVENGRMMRVLSRGWEKNAVITSAMLRAADNAEALRKAENDLLESLQ